METTSNAAALAQAMLEVADLITANTNLSVQSVGVYGSDDLNERVNVSVWARPGDVQALAEVLGATERSVINRDSPEVVVYSVSTPGYDLSVWGRTEATGGRVLSL